MACTVRQILNFLFIFIFSLCLVWLKVSYLQDLTTHNTNFLRPNCLSIRELGYKNGEDHIRDCKEAEHKKRKQILMMEQHAALQGETKLIANKVMDEPQLENTEEFDDEDDEELAMARQLEETEMGSEDEQEMEDQNAPTQAYDDSHDDHETEQLAEALESMDDEEDNQVKVVSTGHDNEVDEKCAQKPEDLETPGLLSSPGGETTTTKASEGNIVTPSSSKNLEETITFDPSCTEPTEEIESKHGRDTDPVTDSNNDSKEIEHSAQDQGAEADKSSDADHISDDETPITKKPKNAAWQAMLQKEKEALLREKKRRRRGGGLVDGEAEEEEEDEGIVGLEDFGFAVQKKNDDEDEDVDVDEDDLEHVVDDVSDDEGDEEAGDAARKRLEAKEEKDRHKEIIRRMREGYDGRRGGIASGIGGARGMHRFDQLVAADNRDDAKRLGLLNDDEINSEDEEGGEGKNEKKDGGDDEDDEAALLDKMLKERFLQRQDEGFLEEDFSDDEDDEDESGEIGESHCLSFCSNAIFEVIANKIFSHLSVYVWG